MKEEYVREKKPDISDSVQYTDDHVGWVPFGIKDSPLKVKAYIKETPLVISSSRSPAPIQEYRPVPTISRSLDTTALKVRRNVVEDCIE